MLLKKKLITKKICVFYLLNKDIHVDIWSIIFLKINISLLRINKSESICCLHISKKIDHF